MRELRSRSGVADGMTIARRLRIMRHRTARWFQPPVRAHGADSEHAAMRDDPSVPMLPRNAKSPYPLH
jgi:hypothetical protein